MPRIPRPDEKPPATSPSKPRKPTASLRPVADSAPRAVQKQTMAQRLVGTEPDHEPELSKQREVEGMREGIAHQALLERRAISAWQRAGEKGPRPLTPGIDTLMARSHRS